MSVGHGKVILLGEHAVVYGRPALAAALPGGAEATAEPAAHARLEVEPWGVAVDADTPGDEHDEPLRKAFCAVLDRYPERPALRVCVEMFLPGSAGLGGSAALSVAMVRAIDAALGLTHDDAAVADIALAAERVFHGNPSGIDSALAASGGLALYRKGTPLEPLPARRALTLVVSHSGEPGATHSTVASVARQYERDPAKLEQTFDAIEALVLNGKSAIAAGELPHLGQLMILNQKLLVGLLLSTPRLEQMCQAAQDAGALGAKLTGGGGGGCMIALCEDEAAAERVKAALEALEYEAFITEVGA
jgi:mevalonate kinase